MRDTIIIIVIIVLIIVGDYTTKQILYKNSDSLVSKFQELKEKTIEEKNTNNRNEIIQLVKELESEWNKKTVIWSTIVMHQELDNVEQALIKAKANIENGELEVAVQEIDTAIFFLEHVKDREKISFKNIF